MPRGKLAGWMPNPTLSNHVHGLRHIRRRTDKNRVLERSFFTIWVTEADQGKLCSTKVKVNLEKLSLVASVLEDYKGTIGRTQNSSLNLILFT